ncbi:MAG: ECF transporter S component [Firmicutes bacterium]|nr:ECF transporter S component [Bacillota bacterium]
MNMMETKLKKTSVTVLTAMMMCIIMVAIFVLRIPIPFTQGYVNLSDGIIFIAIGLLDKKHSVAAASLGSMMGDILGGFPVWAPWTFFIKGIMALITVMVIEAFAHKHLTGKAKTAVRVLAMICGGLFMVFGYFVAEGVMYGSWVVAALGVPWNIGQFSVGIILALVILSALNKVGIGRN